MDRINIETSQNVDIQYELAGLGDRSIAAIIDIVIIFSYYFFAFLLFTGVFGFTFRGAETASSVIIIILFFLLVMLPVFFYFLIFEIFFNGQSIGKKIRKIKVINLKGARPSIGGFILRWLFWPIDMMSGGGIAIVSMLFTKNSQRIGDLVAGTTVVSLSRRNRVNYSPYIDVPDDYIVVHPQVASLSDKDMSYIGKVLNNSTYLHNGIITGELVSQIRTKINVWPSESEDVITFLHTIVKDYNKINQV